MYPRTEYEMTEEDMQTLLEAMKPVPMIMLQCGTPPTQQENANNAWAALGKNVKNALRSRAKKNAWLT